MDVVKIDGYNRVTKKKAKKLWEEGKEIYLCPVKMRPSNDAWSGVFRYAKEEEEGRGFDNVVKYFTVYNCNLNETGYYPAFYVKN